MTKNISEFCKSKSRLDGFHSECNSCKRQRYLLYDTKVFCHKCNEKVGKCYYNAYLNTRKHMLAN